jgi:glyoxylase-like metal-dependent hydrolase (beta-lactamase superfamily II)
VIWEHAVAENAWQLDEGLYRILVPLPMAVPFVNAFLVVSQDQYLLIDCGMDWLPGLRALGRAMKTIGVPPRGLTTLLLTHRHPDHGGAAGAVQQRWGGRVLVHPRERDLPPVSSDDGTAWLVRNGVDPETVARLNRSPRERPVPPTLRLDPLPLDRPLVVGDCSLEIIPAPGHSPGQVMLRELRRGWLFTADHVLPIQAPNVWVFAGTTGDPFAEYLANLEQAAELQASLVLPGHGLPWRGGVRAAAHALADYHRQQAARILAVVQQRPGRAWEIARALDPTVPADPVGIRFSLAQALAALTYLAGRGEVSETSDARWEATSLSVA